MHLILSSGKDWSCVPWRLHKKLMFCLFLSLQTCQKILVWQLHQPRERGTDLRGYQGQASELYKSRHRPRLSLGERSILHVPTPVSFLICKRQLRILERVYVIRSKDFPHRHSFDRLGRKPVFLHLQTPFWFVFHFCKMLVCDVSILPVAACFIRGQWKINSGHESLAYRCCASRGLWEFSVSFRRLLKKVELRD